MEEIPVTIEPIIKSMKLEVTISETAADQIKELMKSEEGDDLYFRIFIKGGGCSGYQYGFMFDDEAGPDDLVIEQHDIKVLVDGQSAPLLNGSILDFKTSLEGSWFAVENPNAKSSCGCGSSFGC